MISSFTKNSSGSLRENESTVIFYPEIDQFLTNLSYAKTLDDSFHIETQIGIINGIRNIKTKHVEALVFLGTTMGIHSR